ncbi:acyl-CoA thioesterase [Thalassomonas sp. M1454]|uniref:acyl-CoA thioesterase n=1 Tax=Thalassomonas sp. M1454 TaxID=2594477 RepID=UPI00118063EC|nr:thioesterase family protein [Thalassomonas sp. M1454]TRX53857.1 thioesterase family protein [Thalassomonas sp. M1454]
MHIDNLLQQVNQQISSECNTAQVTINKSWAQGRTVFGGISAALVYQAIRRKVSEDRVLRSLTTNFVGPIAVDCTLTIEVEILREGKNVSQVIAKAMQDDKVCVMTQATFGVARSSKIAVTNLDFHNMPKPKKAKYIPQIPKLVPKFLQHIDLNVVEGSLPFSGSKMSRGQGWMRFTKPPEQITDAHLIALIDGWAPPVMQMMSWPAPVSSVSWNVEFIHPHQVVEPTDWFAFQVKTRQAADGYGHTEANVWDSAGELVAISRQTVAIFD